MEPVLVHLWYRKETQLAFHCAPGKLRRPRVQRVQVSNRGVHRGTAVFYGMRRLQLEHVEQVHQVLRRRLAHSQAHGPQPWHARLPRTTANRHVQ